MADELHDSWLMQIPGFRIWGLSIYRSITRPGVALGGCWRAPAVACHAAQEGVDATWSSCRPVRTA